MAGAFIFLFSLVHAEGRWRLAPLTQRFGIIAKRQDTGLCLYDALRLGFASSGGLLVVRGLTLNKDDFVRLCSVIGIVEAAELDGAHEQFVDDDMRVHEFSTVPSSRVESTSIQFDGFGPSWHTDQSFRDPQPDASAMYCLGTGSGGRTLFASTAMARQDLPSDIAAKLTGIKAGHSKAFLARSLSASLIQGADVVIERPLLEADTLCLSPHASAYCTGGVSRQLVDALTSFATREAYGHEWQTGDLVLWSNRLTIHAATPAKGERRMWRSTIGRQHVTAPLSFHLDLKVEHVRALAIQALEAAGDSNAKDTVRTFVDAELDGKRPHGLGRISEICDALQRGDVNGSPFRKTVARGAVATVDGDGGLAPPVDEIAHQLATEYGAAVIFVTNTRSVSGRLASIVRPLAEKGLVALAAVNSPAYLSLGTGSKILGTNPVAIAAPSSCGPLVIDLALSAISRGELERYAANNRSLPPGVAVDAENRPTRDPRDVLERGGAQLAQPKCALLAIAVEILVGALTGSHFAIDSDDYHTMNRGQLIIAIQPLPRFVPDLERLLAALPFIPGARSAAKRKRSLRKGVISLPASTYFDIGRRAALSGADLALLEKIRALCPPSN